MAQFTNQHSGWRRFLLRLCVSLAFIAIGLFTSIFGLIPQASARPVSGVCYQAHVQNIGWQNGVCNGQTAGTTGQSLRMEALRIWLVRLPPRIGVCYQAHVQNIGWQGWVCNGQQAGTTGQSLRMEAIRIRLINAPPHWSICYQAHVQNIGWQRLVCNGQQAGTTGQSLRMEAIQIVLVQR